MSECRKKVGRYDCKKCLLYDSDMGDCLDDVAPVKHGKWEDASVKTYGEFAVHKYGKGFYECSCCHEVVWLAMGFNYCPQCGARMDGAE